MAMHTFANSLSRNTIVCAKLLQRPLASRIQLPSFLDVYFSDFVDRILAPFVDHVLHVISMRTQEKMVRRNTGIDIARMADEQSVFGPGSMCQKPGCDVCTDIPGLVRCGAKVSVSSLSMQGTRPQPAFALGSMAWRLVNFTPEPFCKGFTGLCCTRQVVARRRTVFPDVHLMRQDRKGFGARSIRTDQGNLHRGNLHIG